MSKSEFDLSWIVSTNLAAQSKYVYMTQEATKNRKQAK
jgi:hypothetical protein